MEIADQDNKKIYKVIFKIRYISNFKKYIFFTIFQDLEEKLRTIQDLLQEYISNDQVILYFNMQYYHIFDEFFPTFQQKLDEKIIKIEKDVQEKTAEIHNVTFIEC